MNNHNIFKQTTIYSQNFHYKIMPSFGFFKSCETEAKYKTIFDIAKMDDRINFLIWFGLDQLVTTSVGLVWCSPPPHPPGSGAG